jgi:hypothetical protein
MAATNARLAFNHPINQTISQHCHPESFGFARDKLREDSNHFFRGAE